VRRFVLYIVAAGVATLAACTQLPAGNIERGESLYRRDCAQCHEASGGIGSRLTRRGLSSYGTARGLLNYNRRYMPYNAEGMLPGQDYLDITAYLLVKHGFASSGFVLTEENGMELPLILE
jgi:mono/diheme cytochrome c family protein